MGTTGGFEFYLQNRGSGDARATGAAVQQFLAKARQRPELAGISTTYTAATQQLFVDLDRSKAEALGVTVSEAFATMQAFFGSQIAGQFSAFSRVWWVILQADANYRMQPVGFRQGVRALEERRQRAAVGADDDALRGVAEARDALQRLSGREDHRQPGAGLQLGTGDRGDGGRRARAARRLLLRVVGTGAAGEGIGQHVELGVRVRADPRVPPARRAVREMDAADRGGAHDSDLRAGRAAAHLARRARERRLLPGRPRHAGRAFPPRTRSSSARSRSSTSAKACRRATQRSPPRARGCGRSS